MTRPQASSVIAFVPAHDWENRSSSWLFAFPVLTLLRWDHIQFGDETAGKHLYRVPEQMHCWMQTDTKNK